MTSSLRLGPLVPPARFRHPSVLAKLVATADEISGGRVSLGLGAGWHEREHDAYGFEYPPVATRMEVLEEQLQVVLGAWERGPSHLRAGHYRLRDLDAFPKPVHNPHR